MTDKDLLQQIALGEDSTRQFKVDFTSSDKLAAEMAAFANSAGGTIYIGVADNGSIQGLESHDVHRLNQMISNVASNNIKSAISVSTENIQAFNGKLIIVLTVPDGENKPYFDKNGVVWIKKGSDKRKVTSRTEFLRLFQSVGDYCGDEEVSKARIDKIDKLRFRDYLRDTFNQDYPDTSAELLQILQNVNLATEKGHLNKAGVLLFAEHPELIYPEFVIKAIRFPGNNIHATEFIDDEEIIGPLTSMYDKALAFIKRNLRYIQAGQGVNASGKLEISEGVFEELLVNALTHRDYFISAPIRIFIYDNRIEIISPGDLPNHLTVAQIKKGQSNIRNKIIASFVSKGLLPYKGIGSGVKRAIHLWPKIKLENDRDALQFKAIITRNRLIKTVKFTENLTAESSVKSLGKTEDKILKIMEDNPQISMADIAKAVGITASAVEKQIVKLKNINKLERIGPDKGGYWKVINEK